MSCCPCSPISRFFSRFAKSYRRRFSRKGLEPSQKQLLQGIEAKDLNGKTLLEIGCGVGYFHQLMLKNGAASATGVDLSDKMIEQAADLAGENQLAEQTRYLVGDFVELQEKVNAADITVLDKVVCCYPDPAKLIGASASKTHQVYALTYPRRNLLTRTAFSVVNLLLRMIRSGFRVYVYEPAFIEKLIAGNGFQKNFERHTFFWLSQVYSSAR